ncbi:uncharacterized protein LOC106642222 isoform X2 [Copidosoma floridanum]|uniref:uncharacterized protein LOC106642222 isoform X2 n=2 Tax=Copidosoma floridanum TaxID=29053 RepID=UPI000C6FB61C|nr:uncharacterized protein LOC106642222 isoform X2 [Copidosoma floridanum]
MLREYGNPNMRDFGMLSSKTVTEVLMLEMKMSPEAKTFLVSGYPRNMRDVVEYSDKIQIMNGVILVAWTKTVLEKQIEYGAKLGHVIMDLAKMEFDNFYKHVMPVAEYFDQSDMLQTIDGERDPPEVYVDFREAVMRTLGLPDDDTHLRQSQVSSSMEAEVEVERDQEGVREASPAGQVPSPAPSEESLVPPASPTEPTIGENEILPVKPEPARKRLPPIVWVLGGPGSDKSVVCGQAMRKMPNWVHLSMSGLLASHATGNRMIGEALATGELVPTEVVELLVEKQILLNRNSSGIVIDGFPRDQTQARDFENKFGQRPELLLLDVALQQSRGKSYDNAEAFKRRLKLFRELSMPLLKSLDAQGRLTILEENTPADRQQFASALLELMRRAARHEDDPNRISVVAADEEIGDKARQPNGVVKPIGNGVGHRNNANDTPDTLVLGNGAAGGRSKAPMMANGGVVRTTRKTNLATSNRSLGQNGQSKKPGTKTTIGYNDNGVVTSQPGRKQYNHTNGVHLMQNGVPARMANGFLPKSNNRVAPGMAQQQHNGWLPNDPLLRVYPDRYDFPPTNLHM